MGTTRSTAADHYAFKNDGKLYEHLQKFTVPSLDEGVAQLRFDLSDYFTFFFCPPSLFTCQLLLAQEWPVGFADW